MKLTAQEIADNAAVAGGCPSSPTAALHKPSWKSPPAMTIDTAKTYTATVKTDVGTFVITLDAKDSPVTVNNFVFLAEKKFYNCVIFHRVIPGFVVQGGDPTGTGQGSPGYQFAEKGPAPAKNPAQQYPLGSVAMANSNSPATTDPTTNGSQFFIVTGTQGEQLQPDYTLFGQVTSGMSVVDKISADGLANTGTPPKVIHRMLTVTVIRSRRRSAASRQEDQPCPTNCPPPTARAPRADPSKANPPCSSTPPSATPPPWSPPRGP